MLGSKAGLGGQNRFEDLVDEEDDDDEEDDEEATMESSDDEDMGVGPSIEELEQMKVDSKRRKNFEKDKKESGVRLR
eukprot:7195939-Karenia_brevis.AAC.1